MDSKHNRSAGRVLALIALALATLSGMGRLLAQDASAPIVMLISGDYYTWDGSSAPRQLTNWGFNYAPSLSPDGARIAYMSWAQITADAVTRSGGIGGGELPGNIWVLTPTTGEATRVVDQPPNASFFVQGVIDNATIRSHPSWSPDGTQLAWSEFALPNLDVNQIVIYDFASNATTTVVPTTPPQAGVPVPIGVVWTADGLIMRSTTMDQSNGSFIDSFLVYDLQGNLRQMIPVASGNTRTLIDFLPVTYNGQGYLAALYSTGVWELVDPRTGAIQPSPASPELYSARSPDGTLTVSTFVNDDRSTSIQIHDAQGAPLAEPINIGYSFDHVSLSPDGLSVAYVPYQPAVSSADDTVTIWRNGQAVQAPHVSETSYLTAFAWGPVAWRIPAAEASQPQAQPTVAPQPVAFTCPGALPPRLTLGGQGRVVPGTANNNLRITPSLQAEIISVVPAGGAFVVTTGPECADGIVWWAIDFGGQAGWTAESQGSEYFLEPTP